MEQISIRLWSMHGTDSMITDSSFSVPSNARINRILSPLTLAWLVLTVLILTACIFPESWLRQSLFSIPFPPKITLGEITKRTALHAIIWSFPAMYALILFRPLRTWALRKKLGWRKYIVRIPLLIISVVPMFPLLRAGGLFKMVLLLHSLPIFLGIWLAYAWIRFVFLRFFR